MVLELTGGPCCALLPADEGGGRCGVNVWSFWYGKRGNKFCASHRAAWNRFRKGGETQETSLTQQCQPKRRGCSLIQSWSSFVEFVTRTKGREKREGGAAPREKKAVKNDEGKRCEL